MARLFVTLDILHWMLISILILTQLGVQERDQLAAGEDWPLYLTVRTLTLCLRWARQRLTNSWHCQPELTSSSSLNSLAIQLQLVSLLPASWYQISLIVPPTCIVKLHHYLASPVSIEKNWIIFVRYYYSQFSVASRCTLLYPVPCRHCHSCY